MAQKYKENNEITQSELMMVGMFNFMNMDVEK
jgi:hypothetical protein